MCSMPVPRCHKSTRCASASGRSTSVLAADPELQVRAAVAAEGIGLRVDLDLGARCHADPRQPGPMPPEDPFLDSIVSLANVPLIPAGSASDRHPRHAAPQPVLLAKALATLDLSPVDA